MTTDDIPPFSLYGNLFLPFTRQWGFPSPWAGQPVKQQAGSQHPSPKEGVEVPPASSGHTCFHILREDTFLYIRTRCTY
jgi:hypothetical protein